MKNLQKRSYLKTDLVTADDDNLILEGYALRWETYSDILGNVEDGIFREMFKKGAFTKTLKVDKQMLLFGHSFDKPIGSTKNGTLTLVEDDVGLRFKAQLPKTTLGRDVYELVSKGYIDGASVSMFYRDIDVTQIFDENIMQYIDLRTVLEVQMIELSIVSNPAYDSSEVWTRSKDVELNVEQGIETAKRIETLKKQALNEIEESLKEF